MLHITNNLLVNVFHLKANQLLVKKDDSLVGGKHAGIAAVIPAGYSSFDVLIISQYGWELTPPARCLHSVFHASQGSSCNIRH